MLFIMHLEIHWIKRKFSRNSPATDNKIHPKKCVRLRGWAEVVVRWVAAPRKNAETVKNLLLCLSNFYHFRGYSVIDAVSCWDHMMLTYFFNIFKYIHNHKRLTLIFYWTVVYACDGYQSRCAVFFDSGDCGDTDCLTKRRLVNGGLID